MNEGREAVLKKVLVAGKVLILWLMTMGFVLIWACHRKNESFSMLMIDIRTGFDDNPMFPFYKLMILAWGVRLPVSGGAGDRGAAVEDSLLQVEGDDIQCNAGIPDCRECVDLVHGGCVCFCVGSVYGTGDRCSFER